MKILFWVNKEKRTISVKQELRISLQFRLYLMSTYSQIKTFQIPFLCFNYWQFVFHLVTFHCLLPLLFLTGFPYSLLSKESSLLWKGKVLLLSKYSGLVSYFYAVVATKPNTIAWIFKQFIFVSSNCSLTTQWKHHSNNNPSTKKIPWPKKVSKFSS